MPRHDNDLEQFSALVDALRPWLGQVIFVGGWAHRLYRDRPEATAVAYAPLRTDDADVALDSKTFRAAENIRTRLIDRGFVEGMSGDAQPPVTHYEMGGEQAGFYAEFLTPLVGGERRRDGSADVTERVAGVVAQKLRHLEVLLVSPWAVAVTKEGGFSLSEGASILIPNPVSYLVQKLLVHDRRKPHDRPKDVLYIHDTIELFAGALPDLRTLWIESVSQTLHESAVRTVHAQVVKMFGAVNDVVREAALVAAPRRLTPTAIQELCKVGLGELIDSR